MKKYGLMITSAILFIIGVGLILFGALYTPKKESIENKTPSYYTVKTNMDGFIMHYEFTLETDETLNTDSAKLVVTKTGVVESEEFILTLKSDPTMKARTYVFVVDLDAIDYLHLDDEEMEIKIFSTTGELVGFEPKPNGFSMSTGVEDVEPVNLAPIIIGSFMCFIAFILFLVSVSMIGAKKLQKGLGSLAHSTSTFVGEVSDKIRGEVTKDKLLECEYCGSVNKLSANKCANCGAPIRNR